MNEQTNSRYVVRPTHCNCHPETCCCNPWEVFDTTESQTISRFYKRAHADSLASELNTAEGTWGLAQKQKVALDEWFEKSEWARPLVRTGELGMHRLDVIKKRFDEMHEAMQEFVERVERGEVRSRYTYEKFKAILANAGASISSAQPTEVLSTANPPFQNCRYRICDLPGQCRGEGKCHHPAIEREALAQQKGHAP